MQLIDVLSKSLVQTGIQVESKKRALEVISAHFVNQYPSLDTISLFEALMNRERLGSTGIGQGIAIPHCRANGVAACTGGLFRLDKPIVFDAIDDQPVDIIIALVVPEDEPKTHLEL